MDNFELGPPELNGLDLSSLVPPTQGAQAPQQVSPASLRQPVKPGIGQQIGQMSPMMMLLPLILKHGGASGVAAFLSGIQQHRAQQQTTQQRQFENNRQTQGDQRQAEQDQATANYRRQQLQDAFRQKVMGAASGIETPEGAKALLDFLGPEGQQLGVEPSALQSYVTSVATPTKLEQKAAQKYIGNLEKTYGQDWATKVGTATFRVPGITATDPATGQPRGLTTQELLAKSGLDMQGLPVKPDKADVPNTSEEHDIADAIAVAEAKKGGPLSPAERSDVRRKAHAAWTTAGRAPDQPAININMPGMTPEAKVESAAQDIVSGHMAPSQLATFFTGMGKNSEARLRDAVMLRVKQLQPDFNFAGAESNYQFGRSNGTQTTVRYIDNISKTVPMLRQANKAFKRSDLQFVNGILQTTESQIGNVDVADFNFKLTLLADEIAKVLQGGGTGSGTSDAKLRQAQTLLNGRMTSAQLETVLSAAEDMLKVRRQSLTDGTFMGESPAGGGTGAPKTNPFRR